MTVLTTRQRRSNVVASTQLQSSIKRKTISRKGLLVSLFVSSVVVVTSVLVTHWKQPQQGRIEHNKDHPLLKAKEAFSLLTKSETKTAHKNSTSTCFPFNSLRWLKGPRLGNYNDSLLLYNHTSVRDMLLWESSQQQLQHFFSPHTGLAKTILSQTICHDKSRFLNLSSFTDLRLWSLRLIYLSLYYHQHEPSRMEARHRYSMPSSSSTYCQTKYQKHGIGAMDYECPNAKFLVVAMGRLGLGAVMRLGAVNYFIAGISTGRVVLFVNNYRNPNNNNNTKTKVPKFLQDPWMHASCPRHDMQCFFWPSSPCVMTVDELEHGYILTKGETRQVFRTGAVPLQHEQDRVVVMDMTLRPQRCPENFFPTLRNISLDKIIQPLVQQQQQQQQQQSSSLSVLSLDEIQFLHRAADHILDPDFVDYNRTYYYFGQSSKAHHAMVFYAMRPNLYYTQRMQQIMAKTIPSNVNPEYSLGLPIRASDKCLMESECLSFATYMKLMGLVWQKHYHDNTKQRGNVIVTSESAGVVREKQAFEGNHTLVQSLPFALRFIMNEDDVMQGTGLPRNFHIRSNHSGTPYSADDIMLSAVTSLKIQLMAKYTIGNCCSNFHLLLFDFLRDGCGAATHNVHQCLQEHESPEFRVCCMWSDTAECNLRRQQRDEKEKKKKKKGKTKRSQTPEVTQNTSSSRSSNSSRR